MVCVPVGESLERRKAALVTDTLRKLAWRLSAIEPLAAGALHSTFSLSFQELCPVIHTSWRPFGLDGKSRPAVSLGCAIAGPPALGVIVR